MIRIDPEFRALIPPIKPEERAQLEANIIEHGCRDPLALWHGTLIDGHNRYEICTRLGIAFRTIEIALPTRSHALLCIEENQLGRRNLTDDQRAAVALSALDRRTALARIERAKQGGRGRKKNLEVAVTPEFKERTRTAVAKEAQVPERKLRALKNVRDRSPELYARVRSGEITLAEARFGLQRADKAELRKQIEAEAPKYPDGPFRVVVVDPPWRYDVRQEDATHRSRVPYPDMSLDEIRALPIQQLAHDDCVLFTWTTNSFMEEACAIVRSWGFEKKTILTWFKDKMGTGAWLRGKTEHCIMAVRGRPVVTLTNQTTALSGPVREHSRKPDEFYKLVESLCSGSRVELFSREPREGWATWGAELQKFKATG